MSKPLITVIIPIYKVEKYLKKCIDSVLEQTYKNLEIILVDDGSPDNCGSICDEYANRDERIRVIHKNNGGLSDARNVGLDVMRGEYVAFVDSDDWIEAQMYEKLYNLITHFQADLAFGGVTDDVFENGEFKSVKISNYGTTPFAENAVDAMRRFFHGSWAAWDKLYKAELFNGIRYPVGEINEDEAIVLQVLSQCNKVCYTNEIFYHYVKRVDGSSITTSSFSYKKLDWVKHCSSNYDFICARYPELLFDAASRYRSSILWSLTEMILSTDDYKIEIQHWRDVLRENGKMFKRVPFLNLKERIRFMILKNIPIDVCIMLFKKYRGI